MRRGIARGAWLATCHADAALLAKSHRFACARWSALRVSRQRAEQKGTSEAHLDQDLTASRSGTCCAWRPPRTQRCTRDIHCCWRPRPPCTRTRSVQVQGAASCSARSTWRRRPRRPTLGLVRSPAMHPAARAGQFLHAVRSDWPTSRKYCGHPQFGARARSLWARRTAVCSLSTYRHHLDAINGEYETS